MKNSVTSRRSSRTFGYLAVLAALAMAAVLFFAAVSTAPTVQAFGVVTSKGGSRGGSGRRVLQQQQRLPTTKLPLARKAAAASSSKSKSKSKSASSSKSAPPTMKRAEFVTLLSERTSWTKKETEENLQCVLSAIQESVNDGYKVNFQGFGSFAPKQRAARKGRNPSTGEEMDIPASVSPGFTASKGWKDEMKGRMAAKE